MTFPIQLEDGRVYDVNADKFYSNLEAAEAAWRSEEMDLNDYSTQSHEDNLQWWLDAANEPLSRNKGELIALMHSELSEALEGERKNLQDEHLPARKSVEVELADCLIRIFDYAGAYGLDLEGAYQEKRLFNAQRADHKLANRMKEGGKKW